MSYIEASQFQEKESDIEKEINNMFCFGLWWKQTNIQMQCDNDDDDKKKKKKKQGRKSRPRKE